MKIMSELLGRCGVTCLWVWRPKLERGKRIKYFRKATQRDPISTYISQLTNLQIPGCQHAPVFAAFLNSCDLSKWQTACSPVCHMRQCGDLNGASFCSWAFYADGEVSLWCTWGHLLHWSHLLWLHPAFLSWAAPTFTVICHSPPSTEVILSQCKHTVLESSQMTHIPWYRYLRHRPEVSGFCPRELSRPLWGWDLTIECDLKQTFSGGRIKWVGTNPSFFKQCSSCTCLEKSDNTE